MAQDDGEPRGRGDRPGRAERPQQQQQPREDRAPEARPQVQVQQPQVQQQAPQAQQRFERPDRGGRPEFRGGRAEAQDRGDFRPGRPDRERAVAPATGAASAAGPGPAATALRAASVAIFAMGGATGGRTSPVVSSVAATLGRIGATIGRISGVTGGGTIVPTCATAGGRTTGAVMTRAASDRARLFQRLQQLAGTAIGTATTRNWNRDWRRDNRYNYSVYRNQNRNAFRLPRYYAPYGWGYGYRRFSIGFTLSSILFDQDYWIDDADYYRLPPAYGPYRWVRYYNDALLVDIRTGYVVDTVYDIFW